MQAWSGCTRRSGTACTHERTCPQVLSPNPGPEKAVSTSSGLSYSLKRQSVPPRLCSLGVLAAWGVSVKYLQVLVSSQGITRGQPGPQPCCCVRTQGRLRHQRICCLMESPERRQEPDQHLRASLASGKERSGTWGRQRFALEDCGVLPVPGLRCGTPLHRWATRTAAPAV